MVKKGSLFFIGLMIWFLITGINGGCGSQQNTAILEGQTAKYYLSTVLSQISDSAHIYYISGDRISSNGIIYGEGSSSYWDYHTTYPYIRVRVYANGDMDEYSPVSYDYDNLNVLDDWLIDSDDALAVAEDNGGKEHRESKNCEIRMTLYPSYEAYANPVWIVHYHGTYISDQKDFFVNAKTGSLEAID